MENTDNYGRKAGGYEEPRLTMHGSVAEVTRATHAGTRTDRAFPAGTPITSLTFS